MFLLIFFLWWGAVAEATDELPQITVKARREPVTAVPESSTTLEVEASAADVAQVAASIPTARTQRRGENDWELPTLRGELSGQNRWFLESIPLTSSAFGVSQAHLVPPEALAALQVFPGSIPASFAEDGLGGAFLMRFTWPEGRRVRAGVRLGSFGSRRMAVQGGIRNGAIDAIYHQGDDNFPYLDNNGTPFNTDDDRWRVRENASFSRLTLLPRAQWQLLGEAGKSYALISQGRSQISGPVSAPDGGLLNDRYLLVANEWGSDHARLAIFVSFDGQEYTPGSGFGVVANALKTDDRLFGVSYRSQLEAWRFTVQPQFETIEMTGRLSSTNESKWWLPLSVGWSTFILDWSLSPGLVYHHVEYPGASRRYDLVSPRVVVKRQFRDWNFASTLGSYFRHPTMAELYGQPQVLVGNSALKPERSAKAEVSLGQKFSRLNWTLTHYHSLAEDIIVNTQNAQNIMTSMNVGRSWIWGTVAEVTARSGGWEAGASVSQLSTVNLSEIPSQIGKSLPLRPSVELKSRLAWHTDRLRLEVSHTLYGPMALDAANRQELSMTHSLDLMTAYRLGVWGDLGLEITNLLDTVLATRVVGDYRFDAPTSGLLGYPAPGRRIGISWRIEL